MAHFNSTTWNHIIAQTPSAHILQTWQWAEFKSLYGWKPIFCVWAGNSTAIQLVHYVPKDEVTVRAAALILRRAATIRGIKLPFNILYVPKGPLLVDWEDVALRQKILSDLNLIAQKNRSISIKIDPDVPIGYGEPGSKDDHESPLGKYVEDDLLYNGWHYSNDQIQFRNTVLVDLNQTEDEILARMKQKTRYNIRLAARKGIIVRKGNLDELEMLYQMYAETAFRDNFIIRDREYYLNVWRLFMDANMAQPFIAEFDGKPIAALIMFHFLKKAWYLYGMSVEAHREKMPNHLLQWEAIRHAKSLGCSVYDMWGAPDDFHENDPMWGVYRFKEGFGGKVVRTIGAWDKPVQYVLYRFYSRIMPQILEGMRRRHRKHRQRNFEN